MMTNDDAMRLAINLAKKGTGYVSPNPLVGAVIIKNERIAGVGYHHKFGNIHAEIDAINNCSGIDFEGAELILNLEPCSHYGKQPPCTDAIIEKKFARVVIGMTDPNPKVSGNGINKLKKAGIEVITGVFEEECKWLNRFFVKHIQSGMPYIIAKIAQSLNGKMSYPDNNPKWISSVESRRTSHLLRFESDAVAVGKRTVLTDDPELTVRMIDGRNPYRIILDTNLELPLDRKVFTDEFKERTIVICSTVCRNTEKAKALSQMGIRFLFQNTEVEGRIDLESSFRDLYNEFGIGSVLVEGGSELHGNLFRSNLLDEIHMFIAPVVIHGGVQSFTDVPNISENIQPDKYKIIRYEMSGVDIHLTLVRNS